LNAIGSLVKAAKKSGLKKEIGFEDLKACHLYMGVSSESIQQFLDKIHVCASNSKFIKPMIQDYVSDTPELKEWSVALMSLKNENTVDLFGHSVALFSRNAKHDSQNSESHTETILQTISTPGHEIIDLEDQIKETFVFTEDVLQPKNEPRSSDTKLRHKYRPKERGLVLIYPLKSNVQMTDEEYQKQKLDTKTSFPLRGVGQLFGISIVFPYSGTGTASKLYFKNRSV
jgi:hypothetical protein